MADWTYWAVVLSLLLNAVLLYGLIRAIEEINGLRDLLICQRHELQYRRSEMRLQKFLNTGELEPNITEEKNNA